MFFLTFFKDLIKILRSNQSPAEIGGGFILGMLLGFTPFWSLINVAVVIVLIVINVNIASAMFAYAIFSAIVYLADPLLHLFGRWILTGIPALQPLWTYLYHAPVWPYTSFNNTVYMGSLITGILLLLPVYMGIKKGVLYYRENYDEKISQWKWVKWLKASPVYEWYEKLKFLGG